MEQQLVWYEIDPVANYSWWEPHNGLLIRKKEHQALHHFCSSLSLSPSSPAGEGPGQELTRKLKLLMRLQQLSKLSLPGTPSIRGSCRRNAHAELVSDNCSTRIAALGIPRIYVHRSEAGRNTPALTHVLRGIHRCFRSPSQG